MTDVPTKSSWVEFARIETDVLGNCRASMRGITELAADISERGLLQPLVVWHRRMKSSPFTLPDGREVWDRYILVAGNRRYAAIAKIREEDPKAFGTVRVTLFAGNESDALFAQIAENLQREDLTPLDLANAIHRMKQRGHGQQEIAKRLAKSQAWVSRLLRLRESASEDVLRAVGRGELPVDTALAIAELDEGAQKQALEKFLAETATNGKREATRNAKAATGRPTRPPLSELRERFGAFGNGKPVTDPKSPPEIAHAVLGWVIGKGRWPASIPMPKPATKS